jgi:hypothetical protein
MMSRLSRRHAVRPPDALQVISEARDGPLDYQHRVVQVGAALTHERMREDWLDALAAAEQSGWVDGLAAATCIRAPVLQHVQLPDELFPLEGQLELFDLFSSADKILRARPAGRTLQKILGRTCRLRTRWFVEEV